MNLKTARALKADKRREELLATGLRLFAQRGFRATTIADIAEATGTAHGLVYHYLLRLVIAESGTNPVVAEALQRLTNEGERLMVDYLNARIEAGELRPHDPSVPARALFWAVITKHLGPPRQDDFERDLVNVLLEGIRLR